METVSKEVEAFRQFADERLHNHIEELKTRYSNRSVASEELIETSIIKHQQIFNTEMNEKIDQLVASDNPWLKEQLKSMKDRFLLKLDLKEQM
jgi:hypothetical protein